MSIQRIDVGPRMSQVVIHGDTVYLAGVVAQKTTTEGVADQTREILAQIDGYLALKWEEVYAYEHSPHPIEFKMYYSV